MVLVLAGTTMVSSVNPKPFLFPLITENLNRKVKFRSPYFLFVHICDRANYFFSIELFLFFHTNDDL